MGDELVCMVIADDFTGSCDTGLQFTTAGYHTRVAFEASPAAFAAAEVAVLDTETRNSSTAAARERLLGIQTSLREIRAKSWYKKIDSTVRGPVGAEVAALMEILGFQVCLLAPAFPSTGRITVGGYQLLDGVPVHRTEIAADPGALRRNSSLLDMFEDEDVDLKLVDLGVVERGADRIAECISDSVGSIGQRRRTVVVLDAASPKDLASIAAAAAQLPSVPLMCGSAGLAAGLLSVAPERSTDAITAAGGQVGGPFLVVAGSSRDLTEQQLLRGERELGVGRLQLPQGASRVDRVRAGFAGGQDSILAAEPGLSNVRMEAVVADLAATARLLCESRRPCAILVTGGWTAATLMREFEARAVEIICAVDDGVPLSRLEGGPFDGLYLITKAGALGEEGIIGRAVSMVRRTKPTTGPADEEDVRPVLGITMGDPCGIGAEVIAKALGEGDVYDQCRPLVLGHPEILRKSMKQVAGDADVVEIDAPEAANFRRGMIEVLNPVSLDLGKIEPGRVCAEAGRGAVGWVMAAADLALAGRLDGVVTAPLNKEAMNLAGYAYAGHTELLGERTNTRDYRMLLAAQALKVVHVTVHVALNQVPSRLSVERVYKTIQLGAEALVDMGCEQPRIGVSGLNPHAGEHGLFGDEDAVSIAPAVEQSAADGWDVVGPLPGDTLFHRAYSGEFDLVVAMYHDQGHIPIKLVAFADAVNVTLGLPVVRTSVDHGTAFDIVGRGIADHQNMVEAIAMASKLARSRASRPRSSSTQG